MAHRETDGDESYDFVTSEGADDGPVTDGGGNIVLETGHATILSQVTFESQTTTGGSVTVASATLHDGGFVTIHDATVANDPLGSVQGTSTYLAPGTQENVTVELDEEISSSGTFFAMPHYDTDGDESYDFVTSEGADDGPYVAKGIVLSPAQVNVSGTGNQPATVTLNNQSANGQATNVTVASATLPAGGFVTIHDATVTSDAIGSVRGTSSYLDAGNHSDVSVSLDDPVTESGKLFAMPHRDTNDNQQYDFVSSEGGADGPYTAGDEIVLDAATVQIAMASVTFEAQETSGDSVTVASTNLSQGGFVTIHDATVTSDAIGSVRGTSGYLEAGSHSDVSVSLDAPVEEPGMFFAMPHRDTNDNQQYDFVSSEGGADGPYTTVEGDIVLQGAQVTLSDGNGGDGTDTPTTADGGDGASDGGSSPQETSTGGQPGLGIVAGILALLGAALLARRD
jgi:PGF-CTERM protein